MYLCPQCPRVYSEHQELRAHLGGEHGLSGELELAHTPLYACELCANVTHISKRSFCLQLLQLHLRQKEQFGPAHGQTPEEGAAALHISWREEARRPRAEGFGLREHASSKRRRVAASQQLLQVQLDGPLSQSSSPTLK